MGRPNHTVDGAFVAGSLILDDGERVYDRQGTAKRRTDRDVNDLLHWEAVRTAAERGHRIRTLGPG
ncbi:hypothetical protein BRC76_05415 [Halobacteriales archaeon QH_8_67_36]|nr:MAG: hypothetical protein BRC76_05415 [Halobacteriales archaeon QH_8_67_36]